MKKFKAITIALAAVGVGSMCGLVYADIDPYDESKCLSNYSCQATTTVYSGFSTLWPGGTSESSLYGPMKLKDIGFTTVATPFAIQLKEWGTRAAYVNAVIDDAADGENGRDNNGKPMCFQLEGDDDNLLIPQEFCGGNGWPLKSTETLTHGGWDVQNDCTGITTAYAAGSRQGIVNMCKKKKATIKGNNCEAFCTLANANNKKFYAGTDFTKKLMQSFINNGSCLPSSKADSTTYTHPTDKNYTTPCTTTSTSDNAWPNWCTGRNMHFDGLNKDTGTVVNFKVVHCSVNGKRKVGVKKTSSTADGETTGQFGVQKKSGRY